MFCVNSITSYKFNGIPLTDTNIPRKIVEYNNFVNSNLSEKNLDKDNLNIITVNGLYGYRTGIIGWCSNFCSFYLSKKSNPTRFQRFLNYIFNKDDKILGNDFEIISYILSLFNRCIPIINYGNWDPKKFLCTNDNEFINLSMPKIFDFPSLYLLSPLYDSGCAIYSNKIPKFYGFKKWNVLYNINFNDKQFNKGMLWSFYIHENSGILIINLCLHNSDTCLLYNMQIQQTIQLKKELETKFCKDLDNYEIYITGDFKSEFNSILDNELQSRLNMLTEEKLQLISNKEDTSTTQFIFYSSSNPKRHISLSNIDILDNEFININNKPVNNDHIIIDIEDKNEVIIDNKIFEDKNDVIIEPKIFSHIKEEEVELKNINFIKNYFTVETKPDTIQKNVEEETNIKSEWQFL